jgi:hypothetical protein
MSLRSSAVLLACVVFAGSVVAQDRRECLALSGVDAAKLRNIRVLSAIPQSDALHQTLPLIRVSIDGGNASGVGSAPGLGLIGAVVAAVIVQSVINSQVERAVERATLAFPPLTEAAKDFDFRRHFWARLDEEMHGEGRFKVAEVLTFSGERSYTEQSASVDGEAVDAILDLRTQYALSPDLRSFVMSTQVLLQARDDNREIYRCRYDFTTPPVAEGEYEAAIAAWAANDAALYRAAAVLGMRETLKMLRFDLTGLDAPRPGGEEVSLHDGRPIAGGSVRVAMKSNVVHREDGVVIGRDSIGVMRAAVQGTQFTPSDEQMAAAHGAGGGERRRQVRVGLDDLLGVLEENAPVQPKQAAAPAAPPKESPPPAARTTGADDLDDLLK